MGFFFSIIALSVFFSFYIGALDFVYDKYFIVSSVIEGVTSDYTSDSIFVYIPWIVEYEHSKKFTEKDELEIKLFIVDIMEKDLSIFINETSYKEFLELKKERIIKEGKSSKIIIFNNEK